MQVELTLSTVLFENLVTSNANIDNGRRRRRRRRRFIEVKFDRSIYSE
jgi:hypothetical protein